MEDKKGKKVMSLKATMDENGMNTEFHGTLDFATKVFASNVASFFHGLMKEDGHPVPRELMKVTLEPLVYAIIMEEIKKFFSSYEEVLREETDDGGEEKKEEKE